MLAAGAAAPDKVPRVDVLHLLASHRPEPRHRQREALVPVDQRQHQIVRRVHVHQPPAHHGRRRLRRSIKAIGSDRAVRIAIASQPPPARNGPLRPTANQRSGGLRSDK
eukprot:780399-Prorocentrum_minimum.AAC.1